MTTVMKMAFAPVALNVIQIYVRLLQPLRSMQLAGAFIRVRTKLISNTAENICLYHKGSIFIYINVFIYSRLFRRVSQEDLRTVHYTA
jgi:hypothetical protein